MFAPQPRGFMARERADAFRAKICTLWKFDHRHVSKKHKNISLSLTLYTYIFRPHEHTRAPYLNNSYIAAFAPGCKRPKGRLLGQSLC
jgi:hypothetical protein